MTKKHVIINNKRKTANTDVSAMRDSATGRIGTKDRSDDTERYLRSCMTEFWQKVFQAELDYLLQHLEGSRDVLSVGCGPAIIESGLSKRGFVVTGLDISQEALERAPDHIRTIQASAEDMDFPEACFDAVIYVASLQFIKDYNKAVERTAYVIRPAGKLIVMLLNSESAFFKEKARNPASYVRKIRHTNLHEIERAIAKFFDVQTEYFMGVRSEDIFETREPEEASLFIVRGIRKH